jgi:hypothetical protein
VAWWSKNCLYPLNGFGKTGLISSIMALPFVSHEIPKATRAMVSKTKTGFNACRAGNQFFRKARFRPGV